MLKSLWLLVLLLCHWGCLANRRDKDVSNLGWQAWLLVDPEPSKDSYEEEEQPKTRRITPKSVFIAPAFSGAPPLPDCAEGYRADSMGRCVKLVQLNHAAQLNFLLQRLNAMYSTPPVEKPFDDLAPSDSNAGPLHVTIPLDLPPEPEEDPKESVEVAVVMADMFQENQKNQNKPDSEKTQTVVAVWNVGKNGTKLEEVETTSDLKMESSDITNTTSGDAVKYDVVNENSTLVSKSASGNSTLDSKSVAGNSTIPPAASMGNNSDTVKAPHTAMGLLEGLMEEVESVISGDGRLGNTSRRNVSSTMQASETENAPPVESSESKVKKQEFSADLMLDQKTSETNAQKSSTQQPSSYVRFPTNDEEMNYSELETGGGFDSDPRVPVSTDYVRPPNQIKFPQTYYGDSNLGSQMPSDAHQRPVYWWLPPGWRLDPTTRHQPMLIRFWARMPLLRDPLHESKMTLDNYQDMNIARRRRPLVF
ncbi:hypothetical protein C0J52_10909 [Blattella germanica]|nr:hypothetical protein C0J52_10909 [Blattella germanica]